jgi:hypothetical protein
MSDTASRIDTLQQLIAGNCDEINDLERSIETERLSVSTSSCIDSCQSKILFLRRCNCNMRTDIRNLELKCAKAGTTLPGPQDYCDSHGEASPGLYAPEVDSDTRDEFMNLLRNGPDDPVVEVDIDRISDEDLLSYTMFSRDINKGSECYSDCQKLIELRLKNNIQCEQQIAENLNPMMTLPSDSSCGCPPLD